MTAQIPKWLNRCFPISENLKYPCSAKRRTVRVPGKVQSAFPVRLPPFSLILPEIRRLIRFKQPHVIGTLACIGSFLPPRMSVAEQEISSHRMTERNAELRQKQTERIIICLCIRSCCTSARWGTPINRQNRTGKSFHGSSQTPERIKSFLLRPQIVSRFSRVIDPERCRNVVINHIPQIIRYAPGRLFCRFLVRRTDKDTPYLSFIFLPV